MNQTPTASPAASAAPTNTLIRTSTSPERSRSHGATETRSLGPTKTSRDRSRRSAALTSATGTCTGAFRPERARPCRGRPGHGGSDRKPGDAPGRHRR